MEFKEINENNVVNDLSTTFDESLKSGVILTYLFSSEEKRFGGITLDGQYKFTLQKKGNNKDDLTFWEDKVFSNFLGDDENTQKTWENIKDQAFESFEYSSLHHQLGGHGIQNKVFSLDNIEEIDTFLIELERKETKGDINDILK